jgi:hypothetical protein
MAAAVGLAGVLAAPVQAVTSVRDFGEFANYRYSPLAKVRWVEM